ncbi:hypothetical protein BJP29_22670 [Bacteroides fragilis]|nr:hypothetical protein BJP29_22670 [Bacteroides fragilis]
MKNDFHAGKWEPTYRKSSGSNRVNEENNGSKVGEHRLCKLWKPALRKRTVSSIKNREKHWLLPITVL